MSKVLKSLYIMPWIGALVVGAWLLHLRIPFGGVRTLDVILDGRSPWFDTFLPGQRVSSVGPQVDGWTGQQILAEPVYASMRLPGIYSSSQIGIEFRPNTQPLIEVGVRQEPNEAFAMQPFWSEVLSKGWKRVSHEGKVGYIREGDDASALHETDMDRLLVWYASSTSPARMDSVGKDRVFRVALRGAHDIQAIPVAGKISFQLKLQDMNRRRDKGTVVLSLSKKGDLLWSDALSLAGSRDAKPSAVYEKNVQIDGLTPGVYKLSITADDDIFWREIRSPLAHWVIGPRLYFGDQIGYATTTLPGMVWSNARHLSLETLHKEGMQEVSLGSARVAVRASHTAYLLDRAPQEQAGAELLVAPRGDIRIIGDGYFAFAEDLLFLPSPRRLTEASRPVEEGIRAILTPYIVPEFLGEGWYRSANTYPLESRPGRVRLTLSAPGLQERKERIDIRAVHLVYTRPALSLRDWIKTLGKELRAAWYSL